ncbi:MerR family transcriptional regulator [Microbacterium proteolyticum]|uniref:MerR family transcriptional regulator n=1 Tax=Microbacterium proteolyticum TaxID=1572644 RepID=UPI0024172812|nr:MerR family transcriptional regulator [Microbacterium proteolyticum]
MNEWPIAEVGRAAGVTSRTLRHYESVGLLRPSRVAANGYRFYGETEIARLYRILALRSLDLPLPDIARALADERSLTETMRAHVAALEETRSAMERRIAAVRNALAALEEGKTMDIDDVLAGVDDARWEGEVRERWGDDAWERSAARRAAMTPGERRADDVRGHDVIAALRAAAERGLSPDATEFQHLIGIHHAWIAEQWGRVPSPEAYRGLGDLYVDDPRFAVNFGGVAHARVVRDAMAVHAAAYLD